MCLIDLALLLFYGKQGSWPLPGLTELSSKSVSSFIRDDQNVEDDWWKATGADSSRAQADARELHEHSQRAAAGPHIGCVTGLCVSDNCTNADEEKGRSHSIQQLL